MMKQYFQNLAAEAGANEILLVGDKAILPSFNRRASLSISFASTQSKQSKTKTISKFENLEDDFAPSFPMRKLSSGSLSSKSSSSYKSSTHKEPLFNSRWVSTPPLARSQSVSPVSLTRRSQRSRKLSDELSIEITSVILGEDKHDEILDNNIRLSPVAPQRKHSIEDSSTYLTVAAMDLRRTKSAELVAQVPHKLHQSRWSATE